MEKRPASKGNQQAVQNTSKWIHNSADKPSMTLRPPSTGPKPKK